MAQELAGIVQTVQADGLRRYERPREVQRTLLPVRPDALIPYAAAADAIAGSALTAGQRRLLLGLLRTGRPAVFPGGGIGIEYSSLLKTSVRPEFIGEHAREVARHLRDRRVDLLIVPGMSGYPVGATYAIAAGVPALLLKKQKAIPQALQSTRFPVGSFVIPSYTGEGDVMISADLAAVEDIVDAIVGPQLEAQRGADTVTLTIRAAGADDIIDKAVMAHAITECAPDFCAAALDRTIARHRTRSGDTRPIRTHVAVVTWVTPLIKSYNDPEGHLARAFGIETFAGLSVTSVHLEPPAIGVARLGVVAFAGER